MDWADLPPLGGADSVQLWSVVSKAASSLLKKHRLLVPLVSYSSLFDFSENDLVGEKLLGSAEAKPSESLHPTTEPANHSANDVGHLVEKPSGQRDHNGGGQGSAAGSSDRLRAVHEEFGDGAELRLDNFTYPEAELDYEHDQYADAPTKGLVAAVEEYVRAREKALKHAGGA